MKPAVAPQAPPGKPNRRPAPVPRREVVPIARPPSPEPPELPEGGDGPGTFEEIQPAELDYRESLGSGATAEVFRGYWNGREVAIKEIFLQRKEGRGRNPVKAELKGQISFTREVSVLSKVDHPNLVQFLGVCFQQRPLRVVMEFCAGGSLFDLVHNDLELELEWWQQLKMCQDIAKGMHYLHAFKPQIIHRDLKSLNLLLARRVASEKDEPHVKVTDFGTARMKDLDAEWEKMTKAAGTCHWMAPEVLQGRYDEMADVYSFSMVMYEIICRDIPFDECEGSEVLDLVKTGARPDMELVPPNCPEALSGLMTSCWAHAPRERPSFERVLQQLAGIVPPPGGPGTITPP